MDPNKPALSVVIPSYKRTDWLLLLLESLKNCLEVEDAQVIVVDDGTPSSHGKREIVLGRDWGKLNLEYLEQKNQGPASARNHGIRVAKSDVVAFLDDDTIVEENWIQTAKRVLSNSEFAGVAGEVNSLPAESLSQRFLAYVKHLHSHQFRPDGTLAYICTANSVFQRKVLEEVDSFDERLPLASGDDMDLGFRIRQRGYSLGYAEELKVIHRHRETLWEMWKLFFISGRGAWMVARIHENFDKEHVTSSSLFEPMKVFRVLGDNLRRFWDLLRSPDAGLLDAMAFPILEISNHSSYQLGRILERYFFRTLERREKDSLRDN